MDRESILKQWDSWVKYYKAGGGASWPRDAFESLLDYFEEQQARHLSDKSSRAGKACTLCKGTGIMPGVHDVKEFYKNESDG